MKLCIASDHRGYKLKKELFEYLKDNYPIEDLGTDSDMSTDYTKYAFLVGEKVRDGAYDFGILICGTGIGMSIACNKVKGIRCAKADNPDEASLTRTDNNANVLALSGKLDFEKAKEIVEIFLNTEFEGNERYIRRIEDIAKYENGEYNVS